jgi:4-hydroxy-3-methylbut-2-enyl diphosphate reductase
MEVLLAAPRSFCAGVERAVDMVENALHRHGPPIWVRRQIVHNTHVVARLEAAGAIFVDELDQVPEGATVVFSAHGVAPAVRADAARRGLHVIDATCPLVAKVHTEARRFTARGDTVLLIGHAGHDEVEGTLGQVPGIRLVGDVAAAGTVDVDDPRRVSYLTQTTLAADEITAIVGALRDRFPEITGPDTDDICYATTNRQEAVAAIAAACDLVLVVGSANSSNSARLVEVARRHGTPAHLIEDATQIRTDWLDGVRTLGLTAGASAPPHLVDEVIAALGPDTVTEHRVTDENVTFLLPPALRDPSPGTRPAYRPGSPPGTTRGGARAAAVPVSEPATELTMADRTIKIVVLPVADVDRC